MVMGWDDAIMGGLGVANALIGNSAAKKAAEAQARTAAEQSLIAREQQDLAAELARRGVATQIDGNGNVTAYDKATNTWKTVLSPTQQAIQNTSDRESLYKYTVDAPLSRVENIADAIARSKGRGTADMARLQLEDSMRGGYSGMDLGGILRTDRTAAVNKGFDDVSSALTTQALRSGASGGGALAGALAKQRSQAIASTMGSPMIEGLQLAESLNQNKINQRYNTYAGTSSVAGGAPQLNLGAAGIGAGTVASQTAARNASQNALANAGTLMGNAGTLLGNIQAPFTTASSQQLIADLMKTFQGVGGTGGIIDALTRKRTGATGKLGNITVDAD